MNGYGMYYHVFIHTCIYMVPKTANRFYVHIFLHCEQWFKFLFLVRISISFSLPTAAKVTTTTTIKAKSIITKKAPNANGKWFQVATAHQIQPFISIQTYKQIRAASKGSEKQTNKADK